MVERIILAGVLLSGAAGVVTLIVSAVLTDLTIAGAGVFLIVVMVILLNIGITRQTEPPEPFPTHNTERTP